MTAQFAITKDARYKQAKKFLKEKLYEESIEILSSLLRSSIESYGDMSLEAAPAYYEYGNALLLKEEENPSNDLLGNVEEDAKEGQNDSDNEDNAGNEEDNKNENDGAEGDGGIEEEEPEGDLQIAWEVLDLARCIYSKEEHAEHSLALSDVYMRLGDLMRFNSNMTESIAEYQNALAIRKVKCSPDDSLLSEVHFSLAVAHVYKSYDKDSDNNPLSSSSSIIEKESALQHYLLAKQSILLWIEKHKATTVGATTTAVALGESTTTTTMERCEKEEHDELKEKQELVDTLQETIDALTAEINELKSDTSNSSSSSSKKVITTTIGFGTGNSSSNSTATSSVAAFGSSSSSSSAATGDNMEVKTLQPKKKQPKRLLDEATSVEQPNNKNSKK